MIVIQMAKRDADQDAYFFMLIGLLAYPEMDDTYYPKTLEEPKKLCSLHNIWIFSMGCDDSDMAIIYNREMKKLLKQNKGLDFDTFFNPPLATL